MGNIYLIRHGEPDFPQPTKYCLGRTDWPLSLEGRKQAQSLAHFFSERKIELIYSSPLQRTRQTAEIIAQNKLAVHLCDDLREIDMGIWDGLTFKQIKQSYPQEYEERGRDFFNYRVPQGESFKQLSERVLPAWQQIIASCEKESIIVAHAGVNRIILATILQRPLNDIFAIKQPLGCLNIIKQREQGLDVCQLGFVPKAKE